MEGETLRYQKPKIERAERVCKLCSSDEVGDEWHYLVKCGNQNISNIRKNFMEQIVKIQPQLRDFKTHTLMHYCVRNVNNVSR